MNLGLDTRSGLLAPEPKLPRSVDPLWRVDSSREAAPRTLRQLTAADLEGTHQWKPRPSSEKETLDVGAGVGWSRGWCRAFRHRPCTSW